jgi:hypothetical protein
MSLEEISSPISSFVSLIAVFINEASVSLNVPPGKEISFLWYFNRGLLFVKIIFGLRFVK